MVPEKVVSADNEDDPDAYDDDEPDPSQQPVEDQEIPEVPSADDIIGQEIPNQDLPQSAIVSGPIGDEPVLPIDPPQPPAPASSPEETLASERREQLVGLIADADAEGQDQGGLKMLKGYVWPVGHNCHLIHMWAYIQIWYFEIYIFI